MLTKWKQCPKCKTSNLVDISPMTLAGWTYGLRFKCWSCGFEGEKDEFEDFVLEEAQK